ncbi:hypothetical protein EBR21_02295 [bacterium]|nr:hypothetical protein [bacterium]
MNSCKKSLSLRHDESFPALVAMILFTWPAFAKTATARTPNAATIQPQILDWLAFGSSCKSSKEKPSGDVQIKHSLSETYKASISIGTLELNLADKEKGLSECAIRISLQPKPETRIANVIVRTKISAYKDNSTHMRSHVLLLLGETMVASQDWDLKPQDFAKNRDEEIILSAGSSSRYPMPRMGCGQAQIIGLDYTLEGKRENYPKADEKAGRQQSSPEIWLRAGGKQDPDSARIEVYFEKCSN